ncbi:monocarboxylate transporter 14-like isoform X3 [Haliotis rufescens]|uniref:monocarboxylate transporter 14-like isoform X3 n=1 Tax=Haliotis rufescens TaxID=6454 RepID=UPI00201E8B97|nr:monocarboxylate transporter 14-like isoform X3 [Haliotis rufescens]
MTTARVVDRGYAWIVLFATFCVMFICGMLVYSTGVINTAILEEVDSDLSRTSWVGSTMLGTYTLMGPLAGLITNKLGYRLSCFGGGILILLGLTSASFVHDVTGLIITYGVIAGFGVGLGLNSACVAPGHYFVNRRGLAFGVTVSGAGMGMFAGGPLSQLLIHEYSLSGCLLIFGAISSNMCVAACLLRPVPSTKQEIIIETTLEEPDISETFVKDSAVSREKCSVDSVDCLSAIEPLIEDNCNENGGAVQHTTNFEENYNNVKPNVSMLDENEFHPLTSSNDDKCFIHANSYKGTTTKEDGSYYEYESNFPFRNCFKRIKRITIINKYGFISYCLSYLFWSLGEGACLFHLPNYAKHKGSTDSQAASLFTVMGVTSLTSRLLAGFAGNDASVDYLTLHMGLLGMSGLLTLCFPLFSNSCALQMTFSAAYGMYSGGPNSLISPITIELVGLKHLAVGVGIENFFCGVGFFTGPPLASFIYSVTKRYDFTFVFAGIILLLASFFGAMVGIFGKHSQRKEGVDTPQEAQEAVDVSPKRIESVTATAKLG